MKEKVITTTVKSKHLKTCTDKSMRYFVDGKQITEQEAKEIEKLNKKYMSSSDMNDWFKCQFIVVIE